MQPSQTDMGWGPGYGPWTYHPLSGSSLNSELSRLSNAISIGKADCVTLQPCPNPDLRNQDRYTVLDWQLSNGTWRFTGIFDGHAGHETVDYSVKKLPSLIEAALTLALNNMRDSGLPPDVVSSILVKEITALDNSITTDFLDLFPGGPDAIAKLSDEEIRAIINDSDSGNRNSPKVLRCMRGCTALVSLIDSTGDNLWVASLGDCQAVLGVKNSSNQWRTTLLSSNHNGTDKEESERVMNEHPGETQCIMKERVLGAIAVTRAIGDHLFKLPSIYTERIFMNSTPGFRLSSRVDKFLWRNITPPYISNRADVQHVNLSHLKEAKPYLIMFTDGLFDLYDKLPLKDLVERSVRIVGKGANLSGNRALALLREALGGEDEEKVSRMLTVELTEKWMDDTTIVVQRL